ncbi:MAG: CotH kinase family protein, partial [Sphaerochaetaceae bacterium]|nr:CotH kinase family protein [Sphaerochaetaceae bacterium]
MKKKYFIVIILIFNILLLSCSNEEKVDTTIVDNESIYLNDNFNEIKEIYITVLEPKKSDKKYNYTLSQINSVSLENREYEDGELKVIFQEGYNGELKSSYYGYGQSDYNATMKLRGQSARFSPLKSYKVSLNSKAPWNGYTTVNLNKHPFDDLRIRNKLTFELIKDIPNITSARTQFVHLFVKDFSEGDYTNDFVDYGLFTQIENIDEDYLENHNLDKKGYLYKIENFEFRRYNDVLLNVDDFDYDEDDFEEILEIKGEDNHEKLLNMLDDVNNYNININTVIDEHFDKENLLTWLALNIITDNIDTQSRNYFIYSPENSPTWYFLPWDYDKAMGGYDSDRAIWQSGISNYWGIILINRFLKNDQNYEDLINKVEELRLIFNQEKIDTYVSEFEPIIYEYLTRAPDNSLESSLSNEEIPQAINNLKNQVNNN